ncbi:MAG: phosphorylase family protein [Planctomycetota bacterium]
MHESLTIKPGEGASELRARMTDACDRMESIYAGGCYPRITVKRHWSKHNPLISGEIARPSAYRFYLRRELLKLALKGAEILIEPSRARVDLDDPALLEKIDESGLDITRKKLFLFSPERVELSIPRLEHYTGTKVEEFQRYVLLTNYHMHMDAFEAVYPECVKPSRPDVQMPAYHHRMEDGAGISIIKIGVGPSNAKNCTDHLAVLRPDAMLMVGHCAGVRNHQEIGDFVLASGYMRADRLLDDALPPAVPVMPSFLLNRYLAKVLEERQLTYRVGAVYTTVDRNWELAFRGTLEDLRASRSIAVDMESATVAANGFRYRIPSATLLCISDKPLHGRPKLPDEAKQFYHETKQQHIAVALAAVKLARQDFPEGLPNADIRALDEPLMGGTSI